VIVQIVRIVVLLGIAVSHLEEGANISYMIRSDPAYTRKKLLPIVRQALEEKK
jgi:hypothetical protein